MVRRGRCHLPAVRRILPGRAAPRGRVGSSRCIGGSRRPTTAVLVGRRGASCPGRDPPPRDPARGPPLGRCRHSRPAGAPARAGLTGACPGVLAYGRRHDPGVEPRLVRPGPPPTRRHGARARSSLPGRDGGAAPAARGRRAGPGRPDPHPQPGATTLHRAARSAPRRRARVARPARRPARPEARRAVRDGLGRGTHARRRRTVPVAVAARRGRRAVSRRAHEAATDPASPPADRACGRRGGPAPPPLARRSREASPRRGRGHRRAPCPGRGAGRPAGRRGRRGGGPLAAGWGTPARDRLADHGRPWRGRALRPAAGGGALATRARDLAGSTPSCRGSAGHLSGRLPRSDGSTPLLLSVGPGSGDERCGRWRARRRRRGRPR